MKLAPKRKKGSLELSVNAIVILVMAIAVLGLGLAFIRGLIGQGQEKLEGIIAKADVVDPATSEIPLKADAQVKIKAGDTGRIVASFYNTLSDEIAITPLVDCMVMETDLGTPTDGGNITGTLGSDLPVPASDFQGFYALMKVDSNIKPGEYFCNLDVRADTDTSAAGLESVRKTQFFVIVER